MREIKFRGQRVDTKEWVYGYYTRYEHMGTVKHIIVTDWAQVYVNSYYVIPETVGQYTGLKDKNGKEIYEGDILHFKAYQGGGFACPIGTDIYYQIIYTKHNLGCNTCTAYIGYMARSEMGSLSSIEYLVDSHKAEVISNIHDNPELLQEVSHE